MDMDKWDVKVRHALMVIADLEVFVLTPYTFQSVQLCSQIIYYSLHLCKALLAPLPATSSAFQQPYWGNILDMKTARSA